MDHHFRCGANGQVEGFADTYEYGRRPTGIYIPDSVISIQINAIMYAGLDIRAARVEEEVPRSLNSPLEPS